MISHESFEVEPWAVRETSLDLDVLAETESVFALSNGHLGMRGNLDEGDPHGMPGTYLNSFYETRPLAYGERGYGYPESDQITVNVTNGKLIRLLVDDEPLDVRDGTLSCHERVLDFRSGILSRHLRWRSPAGRTVEVDSDRLVSLTQRAVAAIRYRVAPVDGPARIVVQSELVANEELPRQAPDPREPAPLSQPLGCKEHSSHDSAALLLHRTASSDLLVGAAMAHEILVDGGQVVTETESFPDWARTTMTVFLEPGSELTIVKLLAYGWSKERSLPAVRDQVAAALAAARHTGWEGLVDDQRRYLDDFWTHADLEVEGDDELQQAARFCLFHTLQASARAEQRPIAAKGLTGTGYDGHAFWDTEIYVLGMLTYTVPEAVGDALRWRHAILPTARRRARQLGLHGAALPWRTITGEECSGYWPAGTAAFHVNADVASAVDRYVGATGDDDFEQTAGLELLVETARLWCSLGFHSGDGFHLDGVTGPDEYTAVVDDNLYTNLMAEQNLRAAAGAARRHEAAAADLGVDEDEIGAWLRAADEMARPYNAELGVHEQDAGFTRRQRWDFDSTAPDQYPLMLHAPYFDLYRKQVVKQADVVLAMYLRGDAFTDEQGRRDFEYYEALTVRDSSLSAAIQSVVAAEVGHLELAYDYLREASLMDLRDLEHNTGDGLHLAALAGSWLGLVCGFGGMRQRDRGLSFNPRLPEPLTRLVCNLRFQGRHLRLELGRAEASFEVVEGKPLAIEIGGEEVVLPTGAPVRRKLPPVERRPRPIQPRGREPRPRPR